VGALSHYLEQEGISTAGISLIRPHTEKIRPPRALWVPFELGRPLGVPGDGAFQTQVLRALLGTLDATSGPVLRDYLEDAPGSSASDESNGWSCPVSFDRPPAEETLGVLIYREIQQLRPWYDLAFERRGRTTFGEAGLTIERVADFLLAWATGSRPESPHARLSPPQLLKLGAEELKVFYLEAVAAQPGAISGRRAADWFWSETAAARLLVALRDVCIKAEEPDIRWMGHNLMVPRDQWSRLGIDDRWWKTGGQPGGASD
jgi:hypothetical protein